MPVDIVIFMLVRRNCLDQEEGRFRQRSFLYLRYKCDESGRDDVAGTTLREG